MVHVPAAEGLALALTDRYRIERELGQGGITRRESDMWTAEIANR